MSFLETRGLDDKWQWVASSTPYHQQGSNENYNPKLAIDNDYWNDCANNCFWHAQFTSVLEQWIQVPFSFIFIFYLNPSILA